MNLNKQERYNKIVKRLPILRDIKEEFWDIVYEPQEGDMPPLLTNRPISKEKEFEIDLINKEVSDFLKKENILFVSSLNNNG